MRLEINHSTLKSIYLLAVTAGARGGKTSSSEIGLPVTANGLVLPQGSTAIWER